MWEVDSKNNLYHFVPYLLIPVKVFYTS